MGHRYEVQARGDHLLVVQEGVLADADQVQHIQQDVERELQASGVQLAIFDNRATGIHDERIREAMWAWVSGPSFRRVALLLESGMAVVRANMNAVAGRTSLRAFSDEDEALAWLRAGAPAASGTSTQS